MAVKARLKELGKVLTGTNDNNIDENNIEENDIKEIIIMYPNLLKILNGLGNNEKAVEIGIADSDNASSNENELDKYKANTGETKNRTLDDMARTLKRGNGSKEIAD